MHLETIKSHLRLCFMLAVLMGLTVACVKAETEVDEDKLPSHMSQAQIKKVKEELEASTLSNCSQSKGKTGGELEQNPHMFKIELVLASQVVSKFVDIREHKARKQDPKKFRVRVFDGDVVCDVAVTQQNPFQYSVRIKLLQLTDQGSAKRIDHISLDGSPGDAVILTSTSLGRTCSVTQAPYNKCPANFAPYILHLPQE